MSDSPGLSLDGSVDYVIEAGDSVWITTGRISISIRSFRDCVHARFYELGREMDPELDEVLLAWIPEEK